MKFLNVMCVYILFMLYFDFGLHFLEIKVFVFVKHISLASFFLSKPSQLRCPSDVLIPDLVHSCHS